MKITERRERKWSETKKKKEKVGYFQRNNTNCEIEICFIERHKPFQK